MQRRHRIAMKDVQDSYGKHSGKLWASGGYKQIRGWPPLHLSPARGPQACLGWPAVSSLAAAGTCMHRKARKNRRHLLPCCRSSPQPQRAASIPAPLQGQPPASVQPQQRACSPLQGIYQLGWGGSADDDGTGGGADEALCRVGRGGKQLDKGIRPLALHLRAVADQSHAHPRHAHHNACARVPPKWPAWGSRSCPALLHLGAPVPNPTTPPHPTPQSPAHTTPPHTPPPHTTPQSPAHLSSGVVQECQQRVVEALHIQDAHGLAVEACSRGEGQAASAAAVNSSNICGGDRAPPLPQSPLTQLLPGGNLQGLIQSAKAPCGQLSSSTQGIGRALTGPTGPCLTLQQLGCHASPRAVLLVCRHCTPSAPLLCKPTQGKRSPGKEQEEQEWGA